MNTFSPYVFTALFILTWFCFPVNLRAQQLLLGGRAAMSYTQMSISDDPNNRYGTAEGNLNFVWGAAFHVSVDEYIGLDIEAYFANRNFNTNTYQRIIDPITQNRTLLTGTGTYRVSGIDIPLLLSLYLRQGKTLRPKIYVGPSLNLLTGVRYNGRSEYRKGGDTVEVYLVDRSVTDDFTGFFPGLVVGGGLNFQINKSLWLTTDLRYHFGLANLLTTNPRLRTNPSLRSGDLLLMLGFAYRLEK